jgi:DNA topoisomerase I
MLTGMEKYTLIIAEKPDAASRIASALDEKGKAQKNVVHGVPYFSACRNGVDLLVVSALGHLYTVAADKNQKGSYPVFSYQWVPRFQAERGASKIKVWLNVISKLAQNADAFVDACDFDVEGSIIGYCILKYAFGGKEKVAKRMKYSTLTEEELVESFGNLLPKLDFELIEAGLTRHEADWLYGINLSRALTNAAKKSSGQYATLSTGRVQGPTLNFLQEREQTIQSFVPTPFWNVNAKITIDEAVFEVECEKNPIQTKQQAEEIAGLCKVKEGTIQKVDVKEFSVNPPVPFDLGSLQSQAYSLFKYTPMQTSNAAQHLYTNALISYPRTSSQKIPANINCRNILKKLGKSPAFKTQATKLLSKPDLKPNQGKAVDPAHPAIYPTGNLPEKPLAAAERNVFDLIVKRFLAVFGEPALKQSINVAVDINGNVFKLDLTRVLSEGWMEFYKPYVHVEHVSLPRLVEGQKVQIKKVALKEGCTKPPARFNPQTLLRKMELEHLGTKATRGSTIQTLVDRGYVQGKENMVITELGCQVIEVLSKYCPSMVSSDLTRNLEERMEKIQGSQDTKEKVLETVVEVLKPVTQKLKENEEQIGKQLSQALQKLSLEQKTVGPCPKCSNGTLVIIKSKKSGKRFVGCTNYFAGLCNAAFPLPQNGFIKAGLKCKSCGYPTVKIWLKQKTPWNLCLNINCPLKKK